MNFRSEISTLKPQLNLQITLFLQPAAGMKIFGVLKKKPKNLGNKGGGEYIDFGEGEVFIFGRCFFIVCFQKKPERPFETMCFASLILQNKMDTNPNESVSNPGFGIRIRIRIQFFLLNEYESGYESNFAKRIRIRYEYHFFC